MKAEIYKSVKLRCNPFFGGFTSPKNTHKTRVGARPTSPCDAPGGYRVAQARLVSRGDLSPLDYKKKH